MTDEFMENMGEYSFDMLELLGTGSYGSVHRAVTKDGLGNEFAIKKVTTSDLSDMIREISFMKQLDSQFIIKYYGSFCLDSRFVFGVFRDQISED